jgi:hypothetical protein
VGSLATGPLDRATSRLTPFLAVGLGSLIGAGLILGTNSGPASPKSQSPTLDPARTTALTLPAPVAVTVGTPSVLATFADTPTSACTITRLGPWEPAKDGGPRLITIDAPAGQTVVLHIWIPNVTKANVEYDIWLAGVHEEFMGAGIAWQYDGCSEAFVNADVVADESRRTGQGTTVVRISLAEFRSDLPQSNPS